MAKKEKVQLTPEELAAKKLKRKKNWARVGAVALAIAITVAVYKIGSKGGHKEIEIAAPTVIQQVQANNNNNNNTTKAPETTTAAADDDDDTVVTTTQAADSSDSGNILGTITEGLGSLLSGLGDLGGGASLPSVDTSGAADTVEQVGGTLQDFFYGIADRIEEGTVTTTAPSGVSRPNVTESETWITG